MVLPAPNLDDRTFQNLVDDAKRLVQRRCPEWTDHNVSDPGVTLIEAFAQMVDQLIYRSSPKTIVRREVAQVKGHYVDASSGEPRTDNILKTVVGVVGVIVVFVVLRRVTR